MEGRELLRQRRAGLSLIELLVAVSIMGILAVFTIIALGRVRQSSDTARAKSNMMALAEAVVKYHAAHSGDVNPNGRWPRMTQAVNTAPWDLIDGGFWSGSEKLQGGLLYERYPCTPQNGGSIDPETLVSPGPNPVTVSENDDSRQYICAATPDADYVGVNWAGPDSQLDTVTDNQYLLISSERTEKQPYQGEKMIKWGGSEEVCNGTTNCLY